jgi:hypothetical protein
VTRDADRDGTEDDDSDRCQCPDDAVDRQRPDDAR